MKKLEKSFAWIVALLFVAAVAAVYLMPVAQAQVTVTPGRRSGGGDVALTNFNSTQFSTNGGVVSAKSNFPVTNLVNVGTLTSTNLMGTDSDSSDPGQDLNVRGGNSASGDGGALNLTGGNGGGGGGVGGDANITGGTGVEGGNVNLTAGTSAGIIRLNSPTEGTNATFTGNVTVMDGQVIITNSTTQVALSISASGEVRVSVINGSLSMDFNNGLGVHYGDAGDMAFTNFQTYSFYGDPIEFGTGNGITRSFAKSIIPQSSSLDTLDLNSGFVGQVITGVGLTAYGGLLITNGPLVLDKTITAAGTTAVQIINQSAGSVNLAAAAVSLVVSNSLVTADSVVICTVGSNDTTMKSASAVAAAGFFTLRGNANPTAETRVNWMVVK
jgi:hypothetical protein